MAYQVDQDDFSDIESVRVEPSLVMGDKTLHSEQEVKAQAQAGAEAEAKAETEAEAKDPRASEGIVSRTWNSTIRLFGFGRKDDSQRKDTASPKEAPLVLNKHAI